MNKINLLSILFYISIVFGTLTRAYLALQMNLIGDEAWVLWIINQPILKIASGWTDTGHPYPFYLVFKIFSYISDNLITFRLVNVAFFLFNIWLIQKITIKDELRKILSICYSLSGYFLALDWQVRQYTLSMTIILISIIYLTDKKFIQLKNILIILSGMLIDYAYAGFAIPYTIFILIQKRYTQLREVFISAVLFLFINSNFFNILPYSRQNTMWIAEQGYGWLKPRIFLPYLTGALAHNWAYITLLGLIISYGIFLGFKNLALIKNNNPLEKIVVSGIIYGIITWTLSWYISPLFHFRHLIIVGLALVCATTLSIYKIYTTWKPGYLPVIGLLALVHLSSLNTHFNNTSLLGLSIPMTINLPQHIDKNNVGLDTSTAKFPTIDNITFEYYIRGKLSPPYPKKIIEQNLNIIANDCQESFFGSGSILYYNCLDTR